MMVERGGSEGVGVAAEIAGICELEAEVTADVRDVTRPYSREVGSGARD